MITKNLYYIHNTEYWNENDLEDITKGIESLGLKNSVDAAIGEGAGGSGFETVVEVLLYHPISSGVISTIIWELAKLLWKRRPKKKDVPQNIPQNYRLVIHTKDGTIIGVNLDNKLPEIEIAIKQLPHLPKKKKFYRAYQMGEKWELFWGIVITTLVYNDDKNRLMYRNKSFEMFHQHISRLEVSSEEDVKYAAKLFEELLEKIKSQTK